MESSTGSATSLSLFLGWCSGDRLQMVALGAKPRPHASFDPIEEFIQCHIEGIRDPEHCLKRHLASSLNVLPMGKVVSKVSGHLYLGPSPLLTQRFDTRSQGGYELVSVIVHFLSSFHA